MTNLTSLVNELKATTKTSEKEVILKTADERSKELLKWTHNSFVTFGVTKKASLKHKGQASGYDSLDELLSDLRDRKLTGHDALDEVNGYALGLPEEDRDTFWGIIDRDLKTKVGVTLINKVFPNLIPTFKVALAQSSGKASDKNKLDFDKNKYVVSRKLDGLRCVIVVENGKATAYTRKGLKFETLEKVTGAVEDFCTLGKLDAIFNDDYSKLNFVLDGEICIVDENGNEDFTAITKLYKKKNFTIPNPKYVAFDILTLEEFQNEKGTTEYSERCNTLDKFVEEFDSKYIDCVEFFKPQSNDELGDLLSTVVDKGYEGLMVRKGAYEGKRTWNLQKMKKFYDAEYIVNGYTTEVTAYIKYVDEQGHEYLDKKDIPKGTKVKNINAEDEMLKAIEFTHKGCKVSAGSGFSLKQKIEYFANPDKIVGKEITIQFFEETTNDQGGVSLRFPTIKAVYENGRNA